MLLSPRLAAFDLNTATPSGTHMILTQLRTGHWHIGLNAYLHRFALSASPNCGTPETVSHPTSF
ncbi:hypothetical protein R3P38DRAFT_3069679 [Favolaschia claudopus]|uniref:Uncharacterized protein n=1 Tax=Favolaschia claudopus TaxID=2862362 RepID=A0AAV9ZZM7_9AGAR